MGPEPRWWVVITVLVAVLSQPSLNFHGCEERARSVLSQAVRGQPELQVKSREEVMVKFVIQGLVEYARDLLGLHSKFCLNPMISR